MKVFRFVTLVLSFAGAIPAQDVARPAGWVVISVSEYSALRARAYPPAREPDTVRVDATLTRVDYDLKLEGALASGQATLTVDVLKDGWVRVPVPAGLLVSGARAQGQPVTLTPAAQPGGPLSALFTRRGRATLVLDVAMPAQSAGGEQRFSVPSAGSSITRASVEIPAGDTEVTVSGGVASQGAAGAWVAHARGDDPLVFTVRRKRVEAPKVELPLRTRGSLVQLFGLGEDSTSVNAEVELEILQGSARQARLAVPDGVTINHVPGANVAEWDVKNGELLVTFLEPVDRAARFGVLGEARLAREGALEIPLLRLLETERDSGSAAVEVIGAGEIRSAQPQGMEPADPSELGQMLAARQSPALSAFRFRPAAGPRALRVEVARYAHQAVLTAIIEEARHRMLVSREGKLLVQARYAIRNNQRNFVRLALPAGAALWSASVAGRPVRPGKASDGSLLIPLAKARAGEEAPLFAVEIVYLAGGAAWTDKGRALLPLPAADLQISRTGITVHYPPLFRVTPETGAFHLQDVEAAIPPVLADDASQPSPEAARPRAAPGADAAQTLAERYRPLSAARRSATMLPKGLAFPAVGPALHLASELTEENKAPTVAVAYQKGGAQ